MDTFQLCQANILNAPLDDELVKRYTMFYESIVDKDFNIITLQEISDPSLMRAILKDAGFENFIFSDPNEQEWKNGQLSLTGIASKHPLNELEECGPEFFSSIRTRQLIACQVDIEGQLVNVFSSHGPWGFQNEGKRLRTAESINEKAVYLNEQYTGSISVFGGDFNADPQSRSIRYLTGQDLASDNESSTLWVDAHTLVGDSSNYTTTDHASNLYGQRTARSVGISHPEYLPKRRIDYILTYGWAYGKIGCPVDFGYLEHESGEEFSDHSSIWAKMLLR